MYHQGFECDKPGIMWSLIPCCRDTLKTLTKAIITSSSNGSCYCAKLLLMNRA